MKKIIALGLLLALLFVPACRASSSASIAESITANPSETITYSAEYVPDIHEADNFEAEQRIEADRKKENEIVSNATVKPYQQMITKTYPEKTAFEKNLVYYLTDRSGYISYSSHGLSGMERDFPVECLRRTGDKKAYVLYKTDEGGLIYTFVEEGARGAEGSWVITHSLYAKKSLVKSDFDAIKKGDSIQKVNQIDPTVELYLNRWNENYSPYPIFATAHLLKEGVMIFYYRMQEIGGEYKVDSTELFSDFIVEYDYTSHGTYDCRILPQDYPK